MLPAYSEVLPVLNYGCQTSLGVAISAIDGMSNLVHKFFWCLEVVQVGARHAPCIAMVMVSMKVAKSTRLNGSTYVSQRATERSKFLSVLG